MGAHSKLFTTVYFGLYIAEAAYWYATVYATHWIASVCKHTLNASVNHYLENVEILSFLYIPIKQNVQKNVLFSIQGQGPWGGQPRVSPL